MAQSGGGDGILGIETSTADAAVAVTVGGDLVEERRAAPDGAGRPRHATRLLAEVEAAVEAAGGWPAIDVIAVGVGPGAFTGLRVGIATARALGQARGLAMASVGSLAVLARGIGEQAPEALRLAAIDARREQAYAALYDAGGEPIWGPVVASPQELGERVAEGPAGVVAAGDGSLRFRGWLESAGVDVLPIANGAHQMAARHVCALAALVEPGSPEEVKPVYLRRPDAEVWREQRDREPRGA